MKKLIFLFVAAALGLSLTSCSDDNLDDKSIFEEDKHQTRNKFDEWLLANYVYPYGIDVKYKLEQLETNLAHTLAPTDYDRAQILARIFKHAWIEAYNEVAGVEFTRAHLPREISLIGSDRYNVDGGNPGLTEDGVKVTLYKCNELILMANKLNSMFLHNLHHAVVHYMLAEKKMDAAFAKISGDAYVYGDWYLRPYIESYADGFVTPYAGGWPDDDVAETVSIYLTYTDEDWNNILSYSGESGRPKIEAKMDVIRRYMAKSWNIDLDHLRATVVRRLSEVESGQVDVSPIDNINPDLPSILY